MTPFAISRDSPWTQTAWSQALDLDEIQFPVSYTHLTLPTKA